MASGTITLTIEKADAEVLLGVLASERHNPETAVGRTRRLVAAGERRLLLERARHEGGTR